MGNYLELETHHGPAKCLATQYNVVNHTQSSLSLYHPRKTAYMYWTSVAYCVCVCTRTCACVCGCASTYLSALRGGMADTLPTGLGPTAGGIITSSPLEGLGSGPRAGLMGKPPRAGLRGRGLWGGEGECLGCSSDTNCDKNKRGKESTRVEKQNKNNIKERNRSLTTCDQSQNTVQHCIKLS